MLTTIKLGGFLGKKYGKTHKMAAKSPAHAVAMLCACFKGFRKDFQQHNWRILVNDYTACEEDIKNNINTAGKCIRFLPKFEGSGNYARIVAGIVVLVVNAIYFQNSPQGIQLGVGLIAGGILGMMFGVNPSATDQANDAKKTSYLFGGTLNTTGQGNPRPLLYGRRLVGSQVVSAGISTREL
ncbi:MAG: tail assembly protein [Uliginosibacterium sp.]|nr:tail assembly protein [Uliginosibacterium sp.]